MYDNFFRPYLTPIPDMRYNEHVNKAIKNAFFVAVLLPALILLPRFAHAQATMQCDTAAEKAACQAALNQALADERPHRHSWSRPRAKAPRSPRQ